MTNRAVFSFFLLLSFFTIIPNISGQTINIWAQQSFNKSVEYLIVGDYDNAILYSNDVIRREPNFSAAYTIRGRAYYEKNIMSNAISDCNQAIRLDRNSISALSIRANAYAKQGNLTRAIADWEAILRINPENTDARYNIELARLKQSE
jgi:tetratricopeptide (TPR) repeat protein